MKNGLIKTKTIRLIRVFAVSWVWAASVTADVVINEIFYHAPDELKLEYVELLNTGTEDVDVSGWKLAAGVEFTFPAASQIKAGAFAVIASDAKLLEEFYEVESTGEFKKTLANGGDEVQLLAADGRVIEQVTYTDEPPWPKSADGYSASLERVYANGDAGNSSNWAASDLSRDYDRQPAGTPGEANSVAADALPPTITSVSWLPKQPKPGTQLTVTAAVEAPQSIKSVVLHYRSMAPGKATGAKQIAMAHDQDGHFVGTVPAGKESNRIISFWIVVTSNEGGERTSPTPNDLRPSYSVYVHDQVPTDKIPVLQFFHVGKSAFDEGERYRQEQQQSRGGRGGFRGRSGFGGFGRGAPSTPLDPQGQSAVIYTDPSTGESQIFDFVNVVRRKSGWKVRFHKDRPLLGMTTLNLLYESDEATILNESLAYQLYKAAGSASYQSGYMRLVINGQPAGYHLYFEQPNGNFFRRNEINSKGDLYKLIWMGNAQSSERIPAAELPRRRDIAGRHEKKSHRHAGYQDLVSLIEKLETAKNDDAVWKVINENFEIDNVVNYLAVNSLLSHWDGFFNNYFLYYDRKGSGKWSYYPWDQDSTWSQRGGRPEELYEMPLFFGAEGATPQGLVKVDRPLTRAGRGRGGFAGFGGFGGRRGGGYGWWRDGGEISKPLLANPQFYKLFLQRLDDLTQTVFTEKVFGEKMDALRDSLEPEVRLRARLRTADEAAAVAQLDRTMDAMREHLVERRAFVRANLK